MRSLVPWTALVLALVGVLVWALGWTGTAIATEPGPSSPRTMPNAAAADLPAEPAAATDAQRTPVKRTDANTAALPSPSSLEGRVIDAATKAPLANAAVALLLSPFDSYVGLIDAEFSTAAVLATTNSDADGRFAFPVERAVSHRVRAATPDHAERVVLHCTGGSFVAIELDRAATIVCSVRTDTGPLPDAMVRLSDEATYLDRASLRTDAAGLARFPGQLPGRVNLAVLDARVQFANASLEVTAGQEHRVELKAKPGRVVRGRVHDEGTRAPVANARVFRDAGFGPSVVTDATGRFELGGHDEAGAMRVRVRADGYAEAAASLPYGSTDELEVHLGRGATIAGRVVDERGRGLASASGFLAAHRNPGFEVKPLSFDGEGRFAARCLSPKARYWLVARAPARGTQVRALAHELANGERLDVPDLVLLPESTLEGRVVDDQDRPLADLWIECNGFPDGVDEWIGAGSTPVPPHAKNRIARTDADGRFRLSGLGAGEYLVAVRQANVGRAAERTIRIDHGEARVGVDFAIATGLPIAGVFVPVSAATFETQFALYVTSIDTVPPTEGWANVNLDGSFRIEGMQRGRYAVELLPRPTGQVLPPGTVVEAGREDLRLVLEAAHAVAGTVVDRKGQPVAARVVCMSEPDHAEVAIGLAAADGSFHLEVPASFQGLVVAFPLDGARKPVRLGGVVADRVDLVLVVDH